MVPTSWRVRESGGAMALMPWCYAARSGLVRLVVRLPVGVGALSDIAALGDRRTSVLERSCSANDEGRWCLPAGVFALFVADGRPRRKLGARLRLVQAEACVAQHATVERVVVKKVVHVNQLVAAVD